jgi:hypothetical protein
MDKKKANSKCRCRLNLDYWKKKKVIQILETHNYSIYFSFDSVSFSIYFSLFICLLYLFLIS